MPASPEKLNRLSLRQFRELYSTLAAPAPDLITGIYRAAFVGPAWLRVSAGPALSLSGLGGWWGKKFEPGGKAINIVSRRGSFLTLFPMMLNCATSMLDEQETVALHYLPGSPFPWMHIIDEIRLLDANNMLGMTMANVSGLRKMAFPFILTKTELEL